ncbi:MAG: FAD-binding protein [Deltaproteobacteria bacterium]|nr:FAD-binding protein [Deltaproteobacteria bacterium]
MTQPVKPLLNQLTAELKAAGFASGQIIMADESRACYGYDATRQSADPMLVLLPESGQQVETAIKLAAKRKLKIFPRGAASGMSGGSIPSSDGIIISLTRMNRILEIDQENMIATVEPGVVTGELQEEVSRYGLFYPPDPASLSFSTLGGNVAENAGGPRAVKYGVTADYVMGLEAVLINGETIKCGNKCVKSVSGYDLTSLLVGSEGTLAVITKILLKLVPAPESVKTSLLAFPSMSAAALAITAMFKNQISPSTIEFLDHHSINAVRETLPFSLPAAADTVLLVEIDGSSTSVMAQSQKLKKLFENKALLLIEARDEGERAQLWTARRRLSPAIANLAPHKINEDIAVPRAAIPAVIARLEQLSARIALPIVCFGHAGDGNIHVNVMLDKNDPEQAQRGVKAVDEIFAITLELGGTLSGEHGIGNTKSAYLDKEWSAATIAAMRAIKQAFDPENRLNPGKIFPTPGSQPCH